MCTLGCTDQDLYVSKKQATIKPLLQGDRHILMITCMRSEVASLEVGKLY